MYVKPQGCFPLALGNKVIRLTLLAASDLTVFKLASLSESIAMMGKGVNCKGRKDIMGTVLKHCDVFLLSHQHPNIVRSQDKGIIRFIRWYLSWLLGCLQELTSSLSQHVGKIGNKYWQRY